VHLLNFLGLGQQEVWHSGTRFTKAGEVRKQSGITGGAENIRVGGWETQYGVVATPHAATVSLVFLHVFYHIIFFKCIDMFCEHNNYVEN